MLVDFIGRRCFYGPPNCTKRKQFLLASVVTVVLHTQQPSCVRKVYKSTYLQLSLELQFLVTTALQGKNNDWMFFLISGQQFKKPVLQASLLTIRIILLAAFCFYLFIYFYFMTGFFGKMYHLKHDRKPSAETLPPQLPLFVIRSAVLQTLPQSPSSCFWQAKRGVTKMFALLMVCKYF